MRRHPSRFLLALAVLPFALPGAKGDTRPAAPGDRVRADVARLAGDEWQGRRAGTRGADSAADWIAHELRRIGLDDSDEGTGVTFSGVTPGSPAERGGIRAGDVLVRFGPREVRNIYDYTRALGAHKPGDAVTVVMSGTVSR